MPKGVGTIIGKITDSKTGSPVGNAMVSAECSSTTSATDGSYTLPYLIPRAYTLTASAAGYLPTSLANVNVVSGENIVNVLSGFF